VNSGEATLRSGCGYSAWVPRPNFVLALVTATVLAVITAVPAAAAAGPAAADPVARADRALDRALRGLVAARGGPPGAIAVVQRGQRRRVFAAGVGDVADRRPLRASQRMRIASVSKAFSGAVALSLVRAGRLSLDDTIGDVLPGLPVAWHPVTLRQLLAHTSGLPDFTATEAFAAAVTASPKRAPRPRTLLSYAEDEQLRFPPGSAYRYSNSDNVAVGMIAEVVTAGSYRRALHRGVFAPLRLHRTLLPIGPAVLAPFIRGYELGGGAPEDVSREVAFGGWAWASGGIVSTPGDLNRFVRAYAGGRLFGGATRRAQHRFRPGASEPPGPGRNSAGLALFRYRTRCGTVFGHTGSILGYTQLIAATRNGRRSLTFTINTQAPDELIPRLRRAQATAVCAALAHP
jgi:D-alanyl-D-alanine carboxypeptidase